eukprot:TRINITY_DN93600_c0_g1_i1.p1 TRINITY_DN93600_c0_g1~~TRINITY_DN93600_c0_g1_i1.p1  ORF type:complete len:214 (+),score=40.23 TRINITY_DN93600_c0_g1_i1:56-697(+)
MVIPMANPGVNFASLPEDAQRMLAMLKYPVIGLWFFGFLFALFSPFSALSTMALAIFGTYTLSEDAQMAQCYAIIRRSAIGQCCGTGGLQMLMPFVVLSGLNSVVDSMQLLQVFSQFGWASFKFPAVDMLIGIWACETTSTVLSWRVLKAVLPNLAPLDGYQGLPGEPNGAGGQPLGGPGPGGLGRPAPSGPRTGGNDAGFKPFQGQGHRLGA